MQTIKNVAAAVIYLVLFGVAVALVAAPFVAAAVDGWNSR